MDLVILRILLVCTLTAACFFLKPFGLQSIPAGLLGAAAAAAVIVFELRVRALSVKKLLGAVLGSILGIAGAALFGMVLAGSLPAGGTRALLQLFVLMLMSYIGLMVGASKGDLLNFASDRGTGNGTLKILDTSAIIDGWKSCGRSYGPVNTDPSPCCVSGYPRATAVNAHLASRASATAWSRWRCCWC